MGCCISSAGAYPGNTRVAKPAYQPPAEEYKQVNSTTAVAQAHFVTCPGGNALKLVGKPNRAEETPTAVGAEGLARFIQGEWSAVCVLFFFCKLYVLADFCVQTCYLLHVSISDCVHKYNCNLSPYNNNYATISNDMHTRKMPHIYPFETFPINL